MENMRLKGILTIGETETFPDDGGMIALVRVADQIQMQLNPEAAERGGVKLDSQLLNMAMIVSPGTIVTQTPRFVLLSSIPTPYTRPWLRNCFCTEWYASKSVSASTAESVMWNVWAEIPCWPMR